jgi:hypothetical protein
MDRPIIREASRTLAGALSGPAGVFAVAMSTVARGGTNPSASAARAPWPWRAAAVLATLAAGAVLALTLAYWGWQWFGPATRPPAAAAPSGSTTDAIIAAAPFGRAAPTNARPTAAGAPARSDAWPADARLLGVFAGPDGNGYALLRLPKRGAILVKSGEEIARGVTLDAVLPEGIRIRDGAGPREIALRPGQPGAAPRVDARRAKVAAAGGSNPACARPPGFTGAIYRLNAELLAGMAEAPQSWRALLAPAAGALVVRDETGLATMLGMKAGDRMLQANGIALTRIDDVLTAVVKPLAASQPVRVSGTRAGRPREWLFLNAGACPA